LPSIIASGNNGYQKLSVGSGFVNAEVAEKRAANVSLPDDAQLLLRMSVRLSLARSCGIRFGRCRRDTDAAAWMVGRLSQP
jgi:hypothetical protein